MRGVAAPDVAFGHRRRDDFKEFLCQIGAEDRRLLFCLGKQVLSPVVREVKKRPVLNDSGVGINTFFTEFVLIVIEHLYDHAAAGLSHWNGFVHMRDGADVFGECGSENRNESDFVSTVFVSKIVGWAGQTEALRLFFLIHAGFPPYQTVCCHETG